MYQRQDSQRNDKMSSFVNRALTEFLNALKTPDFRLGKVENFFHLTERADISPRAGAARYGRVKSVPP